MRDRILQAIQEASYRGLLTASDRERLRNEFNCEVPERGGDVKNG